MNATNKIMVQFNIVMPFQMNYDPNKLVNWSDTVLNTG